MIMEIVLQLPLLENRLDGRRAGICGLDQLTMTFIDRNADIVHFTSVSVSFSLAGSGQLFNGVGIENH